MQPQACPNCGNALRPGARFCARCGKPVVGFSSAPAPAHTPPMPAQNAPTASRPMITWVFVAIGAVIALVACIGLVVLGLALAKVGPFAQRNAPSATAIVAGTNLDQFASNTHRRNEASAEAFIREKNRVFTLWGNERDWVLRQDNVRGIPTTYFIDRAGVIRAVVVGSMRRSDMDARVQLID